MKLAHRVLLLSVALAVTVWPVALVALLVSRQKVERNVATASAETAAVLAARVEQIAAQALHDAHAMASLPSVRRAMAGAVAESGEALDEDRLGAISALRHGALGLALTQALENHQRHREPPDIESLWAVDRQGRLVGLAGGTPPSRYPRSPWLKSALELGAHLSMEPTEGDAGGAYRVARSVQGTTGEVVGVLLLRYRRDQLSRQLLLPASVRGAAVLADKDQLLLALGQPSTKEPAALLAGLDAPLLARGQVQTSFRADGQGVELVVSAQPVGTAQGQSRCGWMVVTEQPTAVLTAPFNLLQTTLLAICLVVMAATMFLGRWLSARVSEPIETTITSLTGTSQAIAGASYQMATASRELSHASDTVNVAMSALTGSAQNLSRSSSHSAERARGARVTVAQAREAAESSFGAMNQMTRDLQRSGVSADEAERLTRQVAEVAERAERLALNALPDQVGDRRSLSVEQSVQLQMAHFAGQVQRAAYKIADHLHSSRADATHGRQYASKLSGELAQVCDGLRRLTVWCDEAVGESESQTQQVGQLSASVNQLGQATRQAATHATQAADSFLALATETGRLDNALDRLEEVVGDTKSEPRD